MRALYHFTVGLILYLALSGCSDRTSVYSQAQSQTVLVESSTGFGSGVFIKRTNPSGNARVFFWTAAHVVFPDPGKVKAKVIFRVEQQKAGEGIFDAFPVGLSAAEDLALYWVNLPADLVSAAEFSNPTQLPVGSNVFHVGNFLGPVLDGSVVRGSLAQTGVSPGGPWKLQDQGDFTILPGGSGGGVFLESSGQVIGLVVSGVGDNVCGFIPIRIIHAWAGAEGLAWAVYGRLCPSDEALQERIRAITASDFVDP